MADELPPQSSPPPPAAPGTTKNPAVVVQAPPEGPPSERRDFSELRKEVVEARNLIIKTDNLLKNMHAELKRVGERQDEFARKQLFSSAVAYALFVIVLAAGAWAVARSDSAREREQSQAAESRSRELQQKLEASQRAEQGRREASDKAFRVFDQLATEKEGPGLSQAMSNAVRLERKELSQLEAKALDDRVAALKTAVAQGALERGGQAVRRNDHKAVSLEYGRYLDMVGTTNDPQIYFHLGYSRAQLKEFPASIDPLERFLKAQAQGKLAQSAGYWLGMAYEETGATAKAAEAYNRAIALFPGSELAPVMRGRLRKLPPPGGGSAPPAPAAPAPQKAAAPAAGPLLPPPSAAAAPAAAGSTTTPR
jgi:TolA-binding protein